MFFSKARWAITSLLVSIMSWVKLHFLLVSITSRAKLTRYTNELMSSWAGSTASPNGSTKPVYIQIGGAQHAFLQATA
jgi:hypothetical protein